MFSATIRSFFQKPATMAGIGAALLFQVIFSVIWMTGYKDVAGNADRLSIAIVNEDRGLGQAIERELRANLPFRVESGQSLDAALDQLNERHYHLVIQIPDDFSGKLQAPDQDAALLYHLNESNPAIIKTMMQGAVERITATVNQGITGSWRVGAEVHVVNPVNGMHNQMVPMMLVLASYIGAMLMSMNLQQASDMIGSSASRWHKFGARLLINAASSAVIALIGTALILLLGGQAEQGFLAAWGFQTLFLMTSLLFSQIFLILFGNAGMLFNTAALSAQLVTSGAMVPRELLSDFYRGVGAILPAKYAVEGNMNILFGGADMAASVAGLAIIAGISLLVGAAATAVRKEGGAPRPAAIEGVSP